jgi:hypothetical protein
VDEAALARREEARLWPSLHPALLRIVTRCVDATAWGREGFRECIGNNPPLLWKSLWASGARGREGRVIACFALDCPRFEQ